MEELVTDAMGRAEAIRKHPEFPWLSLGDLVALDSFLRTREWIDDGERVLRCEKPGEGNMNLTLRVVTDRRSLIVKQARPWVEKYDHIPAPWDRVQFEHRFYQRVQRIPDAAQVMPQLLFADMDARVLVLEDLGETDSLVSLYQGESLTRDDVEQLAGFLAVLHQSTCGPADPEFANLEMRRLNHHHIFEFPLTEQNGIDLDQIESGLSDAAHGLRNDAIYCGLVSKFGQRYLSTGSVLLHGDYFPGSWLRDGGRIFIIDPEFCFFGEPEFDLGCALAHLCLARQPVDRARQFLQSYQDRIDEMAIDQAAISGYAAVEVMRRLIGVAQLPLQVNAGIRTYMLERSRSALVEQNWVNLWS